MTPEMPTETPAVGLRPDTGFPRNDGISRRSATTSSQARLLARARGVPESVDHGPV